MITGTQLVLHALGDYVLQSDWMATEKVKRWLPTLAHVFCYALPFLFLTQHWQALFIIAGTHAVIDHYRLARFICYAKNFLAPRETWIKERQVTATGAVIFVPKRTGAWWPDWKDTKGTGYAPDRPIWLTGWLYIIVDNLMHVIINGVTLYYLG